MKSLNPSTGATSDPISEGAGDPCLTTSRPSPVALSEFIDRLGPSIFAGLLTPQGVVLECNRSALAAAGLLAKDVVGKPFEQTWWWAHSPEVQHQLREAIDRAAQGEASRYDVRIRIAHDQIIDADFSLQPFRDGTGTVVYLIPSGSVITGGESTEKALRESNEKFRQLADHITDAFWIRSPDMRQLLYVSRAFEQIWGRPVASLYANPDEWVDFTLPEDRERVISAYAGLTRDQATIDLEFRIRRPDGEIRWVRARGFQVRDPDGVLIRLIGIITDITEKKRLEAQSLRAQRMDSIGTLAGGIAHDLNNVLAPILMSVAMLREQIHDADGLALLATLQGSAQHGAELVEQVLSFARGVEGQRIPVNPLHLIGDLLSVMRGTFPKSIDVQFEPEPGLWSVTGDPTQMHQVFLNLCVNARDAMPEGGKLTVSLANITLTEAAARRTADAHAGAYVVVTVTDTGAGIPPQIVDRIFEPFFTTKGIGKGTGLGLSTSLAIVKSHGGFIDLDSRLDHGTSFRIYLPAIVSAPPALDTAAVSEPAGLPRGNGELILMVDDEEAIRRIGRRVLERYGYRALLASEGAEAVALYAQHKEDIALVFTDMAMPVMGGPELIDALLAMNPQVRIIGSSGLTSDTDRARVLEAGVRNFLPKPYTAESMLNALREVLSG